MQQIKQIFHIIDTRSAKKSLNSQKGATLVEFALIASLLFLLLFAIIEFGIYLFNKQVITNASREGARFGIVSKEERMTEEEIRQVVNLYCQNNLVTFGAANDPVTATLPVDSDKDDASFGDELTVTVTFNYGYLFLPFNSEMKAVTVMRYE
jgi:Flp pilus assembly protein TadG